MMNDHAPTTVDFLLLVDAKCAAALATATLLLLRRQDQVLQKQETFGL